MKKLIAIALVAAFGALSTLAVRAADKKEAPADKKTEKSAEKTDKPARSLPFRGKIDSVDKKAKTIKVGERVFAITATTRLEKAGKPATFDDAVVGEDVRGSYKETDGGKLELGLLRIGARPEPKPPGEKPKPEKN